MDEIVEATRARLSTLVPAVWPLPRDLRLTVFTTGVNNLVFRVADPGGAVRCVLRVYRNHADAACLRHEVALLDALRRLSLPFELPAALATRDGCAFAPADLDATGDTPALAVLWTYVPGEHPDAGDVAMAAAAGGALALLDAALADVDPSTLPGRPTPPLGDLRNRVGALEDPEGALRAIPLPGADADVLIRLWRVVEERVPPLYAHLPRQLVHGDFDASNMLVDAGRVSGILDFEFSGVDLRVADLASSLAWWSAGAFGTEAEWALMDALGRGYSARLPLRPDELDALPTLFRLRGIGGLLLRIVRHRQGLFSADHLAARAAFTVERERWLQGGEDRLCAMARSWPGLP